LYHEILEAMALAVVEPPAQVIEMNEADFEIAAKGWQRRAWKKLVRKLARGICRISVKRAIRSGLITITH